MTGALHELSYGCDVSPSMFDKYTRAGAPPERALDVSRRSMR